PQEHRDLPRPRAVPFGQEDALPGAEQQVAVLDEERDAGAEQRRLDVGVAVPFGVVVVPMPRSEGAEGDDEVAGDVRIGALVHGERAGRVATPGVADAVPDPALADLGANLRGDVDQLLARARADPNPFGHGALVAPSSRFRGARSRAGRPTPARAGS